MLVVVRSDDAAGEEVGADESHDRCRQGTSQHAAPAHASVDHAGEMGVVGGIGRDVVGVEHAGSIRVGTVAGATIPRTVRNPGDAWQRERRTLVEQLLNLRERNLRPEATEGVWCRICTGEVVPGRGLEPLYAGPKPAVLPLNDPGMDRPRG